MEEAALDELFGSVRTAVRLTAAPAPELAVLAPAPLLTVTIEGRAEHHELHVHVGGQGYWIARLASELGADVSVCVTVGGETGAIVAGLLNQATFTVRSIDVSGANGSYVHDRRGGSRRVVFDAVPEPLDRHEADDLFGAALGAATRCGTLVLAGVPTPGLLPDGFYRRLAADARAAEVHVVADASGDTLRDVLAGGIDVVKVSDDELRESGYLADENADGAAVIQAMAELHDAGAESVVVTRATAGALVWADGNVVEVVAPTVEVLEGAGAGDSLTATLAVTLASGGTVMDGVRLGSAAAALNVTRHGLGSGRREDIEAFAERVTVREMDR
jgi:1-phosphofructokinase